MGRGTGVDDEGLAHLEAARLLFGLDEAAVRRYIREQEKWDAGQESFDFDE